MLIRRSDWQARLQNYLRQHAGQPFRYGSFDCCLFVCDAIREMTDTDVAADFRGRYSTAMEARRLMRAQTGSESVQAITELITRKFTMTETTILLCQRGDVALMRRAGGFSLGMIALNGREIMVCYRRGLIQIPMTRAMRVWRV